MEPAWSRCGRAWVQLVRSSGSLLDVGTEKVIEWCDSALAVVMGDEITERGDLSLFRSQPQTSVWHTGFGAAFVVRATASFIESNAVSGQATFRAAFKGHAREEEGDQVVARWVAEECTDLGLVHIPTECLGLDFAVLSADAFPRLLIAAESEMWPVGFESTDPWAIVHDFVKLVSTPASKLLAVFRCNSGNRRAEGKPVPKPQLARAAFDQVLADARLRKLREAGDEVFILLLQQSNDGAASADAGYWKLGMERIDWKGFQPG